MGSFGKFMDPMLLSNYIFNYHAAIQNWISIHTGRTMLCHYDSHFAENGVLPTMKFVNGDGQCQQLQACHPRLGNICGVVKCIRCQHLRSLCVNCYIA